MLSRWLWLHQSDCHQYNGFPSGLGKKKVQLDMSPSFQMGLAALLQSSPKFQSLGSFLVPSVLTAAKQPSSAIFRTELCRHSQGKECAGVCTPAKGHPSVSLGAIGVWIKLGVTLHHSSQKRTVSV